MALDETRVEPPRKVDYTRHGSLRTNLSFLKRLARCADAIECNTTTDLIARNPQLVADDAADATLEAALATSLFQLVSEQQMAARPAAAGAAGHGVSPWQLIGRKEGLRG